ncbi:PucR family transcriptional regulator ligand-binding domain-containing protein [Brevibacillus agri]|uniref:PucR family transcriptional regulator n=1 Tax=Brevibacillus agri TaxID=51101 RepID=UPI003D1D3B65
MGITVQEMLRLDALQSLRVIAGFDGLDRIINQVNVLEMPITEVEHLVLGGELVLTTFHSLKDDLEAQVNTIKKLAENGAAALGIHPMIADKIMQKAIVEAANISGLPVILLPPAMPYATVFSAVLGTILNRQSQLLKQSEEINREMTRVILYGGDVNAIAKTLTGLIKQPVMITDDMFEILALGSKEAAEHSFLKKCLLMTEMSERIQFDKAGNWTHDSAMEMVFHSSLFEIEGRSVRLIVMPAGVISDPLGYIFTLEMGAPLQELDFIAISHASTAVALEIAKQRAITEAKRRMRSDFLTEMFEGKYVREEDLYERARAVGLNLVKKHMVLVMRFDFSDGLEKEMGKLESRIHAAVRSTINQHAPKCNFVVKGDMLVIFIHFDRQFDKQHSQQEAKNLAVLLKDAIEAGSGKARASAGIGGFYPSPLNLDQSYREALQALELGCKMFGTGSITAVNELGVFGILGEISGKLLDRFTTGLLDQLYQYDAKNQTDLVKTVEAYLDEKEIFTDVAKRLFVHPNTVKYRIEKAKEILGFDPFKKPEERLNFHLALKARKLLP